MHKMNTGFNAGAELAAKRKIYNHVCQVCCITFKGIKIAKTCSNACRQKLKRVRDKY